MKWFALLLLTAGPLLFGVEDMEVTGSRVNVRKAPSAKGAVIGSVKAGERVKVKEVKNGWA
ncbi:MAG: SH3 domain-containing protein, partial [Lentisphaeria bacterium]|nr:SH3 domain-containing protein [Lentisphaeria bacterium]